MRVEEFQTRREAMDQEKKVKARGIERYFTEHSLARPIAQNSSP
jgi:hypothetical protein